MSGTTEDKAIQVSGLVVSGSFPPIIDGHSNREPPRRERCCGGCSDGVCERGKEDMPIHLLEQPVCGGSNPDPRTSDDDDDDGSSPVNLLQIDSP